MCVVLARPGWPGAMPVSCVLPRGRSSSAGLQAASIGIVETAALTAGLQVASTTGIVESMCQYKVISIKTFKINLKQITSTS